MDIKKLNETVDEFVEERNWEQYHTPKNLVMALSGEVGELIEIFQWLSPEESNNLSEKDLQSSKEEMADILIYLIRLSNILGIDLEDAVTEKLQINAKKYPVDLSVNNSIKYNKR